MKFIFTLAVASLLFCTSANAQSYEDGRNAANSGDFAQAWDIWKPLADQGNAEASFSIGRMLARGDGVTQDFDQARHYFELAASKGYSKAKTSLGKMYEYGDGVEIDLNMAKKWYNEAATDGDPDAIDRLNALPPQPKPESLTINAPSTETEEDSNFLDPDNPFPTHSQKRTPSKVEVANEEKVVFTSLVSKTNSAQTFSNTNSQNTKNDNLNTADNNKAEREPLSDNEVTGITAALVIFVFIVLNGIRLGLNDKMIYYDTGWDIFATLLIGVLPAFLSFPLMLTAFYQHNPGGAVANNNLLQLILPVLGGIGAFSLTIIRSIRHNGFSFGSICVAISKIALSFLALFYWGQVMNQKSSWRQRSNALILLTLVSWLMSCLVNGARVREERQLAITAAA